ncbi:unnamed protein product, partial [Trichogramma brassicae]
TVPRSSCEERGKQNRFCAKGNRLCARRSRRSIIRRSGWYGDGSTTSLPGFSIRTSLRRFKHSRKLPGEVKTCFHSGFKSKNNPRKNYCDNHGYTYFHGACTIGHERAIDSLLRQGVDINLDTYTCSALHIAAQYRLETVVKKLLDHGANPNQQDHEKSTPLHAFAWMCLCGCVSRKDYCDRRRPVDKLVKMLLVKGANIEARNRHGDTPLQLAVSRFDVELTRSLLKHGASLSSLNEDRMFIQNFSSLELKCYPVTLNIIEVMQLLQSAGYKMDFYTKLRLIKCWIKVRGNDMDYLVAEDTGRGVHQSGQRRVRLHAGARARRRQGGERARAPGHGAHLPLPVLQLHGQRDQLPAEAVPRRGQQGQVLGPLPADRQSAERQDAAHQQRARLLHRDLLGAEGTQLDGATPTCWCGSPGSAATSRPSDSGQPVVEKRPTQLDLKTASTAATASLDAAAALPSTSKSSAGGELLLLDSTLDTTMTSDGGHEADDEADEDLQSPGDDGATTDDDSERCLDCGHRRPLEISYTIEDLDTLDQRQRQLRQSQSSGGLEVSSDGRRCRSFLSPDDALRDLRKHASQGAEIRWELHSSRSDVGQATTTSTTCGCHRSQSTLTPRSHPQRGDLRKHHSAEKDKWSLKPESEHDLRKHLSDDCRMAGSSREPRWTEHLQVPE